MFDFNSLGMTIEEVQNRLIDKLSDDLHSSSDFSYEYIADDVRKKLNTEAKKIIDTHISSVFEKEILPRLPDIFEKSCFQETNNWGEPKGKPVSFKEYCINRAEQWVNEQVDRSGQTKNENNSYNWHGKCSRLAHMIHQHLHITLEDAVKKALADANTALGKSIVDACQQKVNEIVAQMKVSVQT